MAKKSSKKAAAGKDGKAGGKQAAERRAAKQAAEQQAAAAKAKKAADKAAAKAAAKQAAKQAAARSGLKDAVKQLDEALAAKARAEKKARAAGVEPKAAASEADLLKLALRQTEAKLVDAEHRLTQVQQELDGERRLADDAAEEALEDAFVDAAVEATVAEALVDAELVIAAEGDPVDDAEVAEIIADTLDEVAADAAPVDDEPSHAGEAADAAAVFEAGDAGAEPTVTTTELAPPLPTQPAAEQPSASWTVIRLREAAKAKGLTGISNLSKAALLERLAAS